jgi:hypothetical protein
MDTMMENWVSIEDDPDIQESEIEEVLKKLEVGKEEDIDDDANSTRKDPMVVDDSDNDDNDSSLGFQSHLEIEEAFRKTLSFAKKKSYPKPNPNATYPSWPTPFNDLCFFCVDASGGCLFQHCS